MGKREYKGCAFIRIDSDRLIKDCYSMNSGGGSCLRCRSQHEHQWRDWSYKLWGVK